VRLPQLAQGFDFDRGMADDVDQRLVAPHVAFQRRDIEVAAHDHIGKSFLRARDAFPQPA